MAIYRDGTASLSANGKATGTGTQWTKPLSLIRVGATVIFLSGSKPVLGTISEILSDTEMNLTSTNGEQAADGEYAILVHDSLTVEGLAQDVTETLRYYQSSETAVSDGLESVGQFVTEAKNSATAAKQSEKNSKTSETNAKSSENYAYNSSQEAKTSETNAKSSENYAYNSSQEAKTSEVNAAASARTAQEGAATVANKANKGVNSDITKLKGLVSDGSTWLEEADLNAGEGERGVNLTSTNSVGVSFGTESQNGGASVFHNFTKGVGGANTKDKAIIGGYGSRPWDGINYTAHSNAAIHFVQDGDTTTTNHGGWLRLLVTPKGKTVNNRYSPFILSNNGDTIIGKDVPLHGFNGAAFQANFSDFEGRGLKQVVNNVNELQLLTGITQGSSCSGNIRFNACGGSPLNPGPLQANSSMYFSMAGFDGSAWVSAGAIMQMSAPTSWSTTNRGCEITFGTTANGTITRYNRWVIQNDGHLAPSFDNNVSVGWAQKRVTAVYAVNGTVQTSDGRLKTEVREFSDAEVAAACALSKEIGFWKWREKVAIEGDQARSHVGMTVQRAIEVMESFGLDPMSYGFICYDSWDESTEVNEFDSDGNGIENKLPAGDRYSFRYEQLNLFIARGFEKRLSDIEEMLKK
jgi:hypothetical protein